MAALYQQQLRKPSICVDLKYELLFHVLNGESRKNKKNILAFE
jgi:hypothetical protein